MKMLPVSKDTTLTQLTRIVGQQVSKLLGINRVPRVNKVGQALHDRCEQIASDTNIEVTNQRKVSMLNKLRGDADLFERAALMSDSEWRVLDTTGSFQDTLLVPDDIHLVDQSTLLGNQQQITASVGNAAVEQMQLYGRVEPALFITYSQLPATNIGYVPSPETPNVFQWFRIPWGKISLYSALSNEYMDFPVYPETISDKTVASYDEMPDMLYQYEPWYLYKSSGPRENSYKFNFHRDMWTGDHRDGYAFKLIQFCKANCYPSYNGSLVNTSFVTLYIGGHQIIHGVLKDVSEEWDGPIGLDDYYLHCVLTLTIAEVSKEPLNYDYVKAKPYL